MNETILINRDLSFAIFIKTELHEGLNPIIAIFQNLLWKSNNFVGKNNKFFRNEVYFVAIHKK